MPNYKKMYFDLFNEVSAAVALLQQAQQKSEEDYISAPTAELKQVKKKTKNKPPAC